MTTRMIALPLALILAGVGVAAPPDPLDLARGLRETGSGELAVEYLDQLAKLNPPPELLAVLPLERAQTRVEMAAEEPDPAKRAAISAQARADFDAFLKTATRHPRRGEASAALAKLTGNAARAAARAANDLTDPKAKAAAIKAARAEFADAASRYDEATKAVEAAAQAAPAAEKSAAEAIALDAKLDRALLQFQLAKTYDGANSAAEVLERGKAYAAARTLFEAIGAGDKKQPATYVAQAWAAECIRLTGDPKAAEKQFDAVKKLGNTVPKVATEGARLASFLEARAEYESALTAINRGSALRKAQTGLEEWIAAAPRRARPTPELIAARYYVAYAEFSQARALITQDQAGNITVPATARGLLRRAERDFRRAAEVEGEYTERANEFRNQAARTLIGDPDKLDPRKLTDPETIALAARVQLSRAAVAPEAGRAALAEKAVAFFERSRRLPPERTRAEAAAACVGRVYALLLAGHTAEAAVVGEHLARTGRSPYAPRAGLYALQAYLRTAPPAGDELAVQTDAARFLGLARYLDSAYSSDDATDEIRLLAAQHLLKVNRPADAAEFASHVAPTSPRAGTGRLLQALAARETLTAPGDDAVKRATLDKAVAMLSQMPLVKNAAPEQLRLSLLARLQLAELYLLKSPPDLVSAAKSAADAEAQIAKSSLGDAKADLLSRAEFVRARVGYGQALTAYQAKDYKKAAKLLEPLLKQADRGPAAKPGEEASVAKQLDDFRRDRLIALALQTRLGEGNVAEVAPILETLKKLGGTLGNSPGTLTALVEGVKPQLDTLRREGKAAEADRIGQSIATLIGGVANEPNIGAASLLVVARGLREFGTPEKALAVVAKIPTPPADLLKPNAKLTPEQTVAVARYRLGRLEAIRSLSDAKRFDEAAAAIQAGLALPNPNDFRKEGASLIEARATAATADKQKLWGQAYKAWNDLAGAYRSPLGKILAGKNDPRSAVAVLLDFKSLPPNAALKRPEPELRKALAVAQPPDWLAAVLADPAYRNAMSAELERIEALLKPTYHDYLAESYRCLAMANEDMLNRDPAKLVPKYESLAKALVALEKQNVDLAKPVRDKLAELVNDRPALKEAYTRAGGTLFAGL